MRAFVTQLVLLLLPFFIGFTLGRQSSATPTAYVRPDTAISPAAVKKSSRPSHNQLSEHERMQELVRVGHPQVTELSDLLLVTTLDGTLHAVDLTKGNVLWSKRDSWGPLVRLSNGRDIDQGDGGSSGESSSGVPHRTSNPTGGVGLGAFGMSAPPADDGIFLVEPIGDGDLYYMESGPKGALRKLPYPIKKIVDGSSPVFSPNLVATKKIDERVLALDPHTGEVVMIFGEVGQHGDEHVPEEDAIHVRRTQYTLSMQEKATGKVRWNITYAEYDVIQNDLLLEFEQADHLFGSASRYTVMADPFGVLSVREGESRDPSFRLEFPFPVSSAFQVNYSPTGPVLYKAYPPATTQLASAPGSLSPVDIRQIDGVPYVFSETYPRLEPSHSSIGDFIGRIDGSGNEDADGVAQSLCRKDGKLVDCPTFAIQPTPVPSLATVTPIATPIDPAPNTPQLYRDGTAKGMWGAIQFSTAAICFCAVVVVVVRWLLGYKIQTSKVDDELPLATPAKTLPIQNGDANPISDPLHVQVHEESGVSVNQNIVSTLSDIAQTIPLEAVAGVAVSDLNAHVQDHGDDKPMTSLEKGSAAPTDGHEGSEEKDSRIGPKKKRNRNKSKREKGAVVKIIEPESADRSVDVVGFVGKDGEDVSFDDADGVVPDMDAAMPGDEITEAAPTRISALGHVGLRALQVTETILGYGSHGTVVYKGSFEGREVAIKRLLLDFYDVADHEVKILQDSDDHPNVVRYYCKERSEGFMYIALELCPASLADVIEKTNSEMCTNLRIAMRPPQVLHQIIAGIHHLHALKIVHRDIKPHNILVSTPKTKKSTHPRILISDFGLGKRLADDQSSFHNTHMTAGGTVGWRAPECMLPYGSASASESDKSDAPSWVALGDGEKPGIVGPKITKAIDIFSAGCVFYYVLTGGSHPFGDRFVREVNILKGNFRLDKLDAMGEEGYEAKDLIKRMIAKDAKKRPDASTVLLHPYFWSPSQRLAFLQDASDRFEIEERDPPSALLKVLERNAAKVVGQDWYRRIDRMLLDNLGKYRKYDGASIRDLLRALRNKRPCRNIIIKIFRKM
ncbi:bifunctional endoribonuclease/protein kinase ire1 [Rhizophlyctis rosea]|nr:bifunctional endoribonuclease/protein kinase ire1 [Rhizophlyctis rosea]